MANRSNINLVGNTTTGQNVGSGACVFKGKNNGNNLQFKTISATGTSIQIFNCENQIYISGSTGGGTSGIGWSSSGNCSTVAGCGTPVFSPTICANTYYGVSAGTHITTGTGNVGIGFCSLHTTTNGNYNTAVGLKALAVNTSSQNTAFGSQALMANTSGYDNTAVGTSALAATIGGYGNVAVGSFALTTNCSGHDNVGIGYQPLFYNTTGSDNISLGYRALYNNTVGNQNIAMGNSALFCNLSGCNNIGIGYRALCVNSGGTNNIGIGYYGLAKNISGNNNIGFGVQPLYSNTSGCGNIGLGYQTLYSNTIGCGNVAFGESYTLSANISGCYNLAIGTCALRQNSTGSKNVAIGYKAGYAVTTGSSSVFIGAHAGENGSNTSNRLFIANCQLCTLIYGEFDNKMVKIDGCMCITNLPTKSTETCVVYIDANGKLSKGAASGGGTGGTTITGTTNMIPVFNTTGDNIQNSSLCMASNVLYNINESLTIEVPDTRNIYLNATCSSSNTGYVTLGKPTNSSSITSQRISVAGTATNIDLMLLSKGTCPITLFAPTVNISNSGAMGFVFTSASKTIQVPGYAKICGYPGSAGASTCDGGSLSIIGSHGTSYASWAGSGGTVNICGGCACDGGAGVAKEGGSIVLKAGPGITGGANGRIRLSGLPVKTTETCAVFIDANGALSTGVATTGGTGGSGIGWSDINNGSTVMGCGTIACGVSSNENNFIGVYAGKSHTTGNSNVAVGTCTLYINSTGGGNTAIGNYALHTNNCNGNVAVGFSAMVSNCCGEYNVVMGNNSLNINTIGSNNVAIGNHALYNNITGCSNVAIGFDAGCAELGSNRLHIANSANNTLIYGEFDNKLVKINGQLAVTGVTQSNGSDICALVWESGTTLVKKLPIIDEWVDSESGLCYTGQKYSYPTHSVFETDVDTCIQVPNYLIKKNINLKVTGDTLIFTIPADKVALLNRAKLVFLCDAPTTSFCVSIGTNYCENPALSHNNLVSCLAIDNITQYCTYSLIPLEQAVVGNFGNNVYFRVGSGTCDGCELCAHLIFEGFIF